MIHSYQIHLDQEMYLLKNFKKKTKKAFNLEIISNLQKVAKIEIVQRTLVSFTCSFANSLSLSKYICFFICNFFLNHLRLSYIHLGP